MKKILNTTMVVGFILLVMGAGGYETMSASFSQSLTIMLSGTFLMIISAYGKNKYVQYLRKLSRKCKSKSGVQLQRDKLCREIA